MKWSMKWPNGNVLFRHSFFLWPYMVSCGALQWPLNIRWCWCISVCHWLRDITLFSNGQNFATLFLNCKHQHGYLLFTWSIFPYLRGWESGRKHSFGTITRMQICRWHSALQMLAQVNYAKSEHCESMGECFVQAWQVLHATCLPTPNIWLD